MDVRDSLSDRCRGLQERRLRQAFGTRGTNGFRPESHAGPGEERADRTRESPEGLDGARIRAARDYLLLLAESSRAREDPFLAGELNAAAEGAEDVVRQGPVVRTPDEAFRAELLIHADGTRPAALVKNGSLLRPEALGDFGELYVISRQTVDASIRSAGRIDASGRQLGGGMLLALEDRDEHVVLTAGHVLDGWLEPGDPPTLRPGLVIDFEAEFGGASSNRHRLDRLLSYCFDEPSGTDYALLALGASLDGRSPPAAALTDPGRWRLAVGETIGILGFPARPVLPSSLFLPGQVWHSLFGGAWSVKRLSPGRVSAAPADQAGQDLVWHDATTTIGSSGSGILTFGSGYLAGVHAGGRSEANRGMSLAAIAARSGQGFG
ncbi:MAG TPA: trypsin-like peptidase domain-containing protein [Allosphingosinicella sp.]|jgi:hypothetical protein